MLPSDDVISVHAYLVSREVRLLAAVGTVEDDEYKIDEARMKLHAVATESAGTQALVPIPFLVKDSDLPHVTVGFAAHTWVVELYEWANRDLTVPHEMAMRINGLLHGYSGDAIAEFERHQSGWRVCRHPQARTTSC